MTALAINFKNTIADTRQTVFTSPATGSGTRIDSFTVTNNGAVNASYKAYIINGISDNVPIIPMKVVVWGEKELGIGLVNQVLPPNASLQVESSALDLLYFNVAGTNLT